MPWHKESGMQQGWNEREIRIKEKGKGDEGEAEGGNFIDVKSSEA